MYILMQWFVCSSRSLIHIPTYNEILHCMHACLHVWVFVCLYVCLYAYMQLVDGCMYWMHALPAGSVRPSPFTTSSNSDFLHHVRH